MTNTKSTYRNLRGDWMDEQGFIQDFAPKTYYLEVMPDGRLRDPDSGEILHVERWGDGDILTNGVWAFSLDSGEVERCNLEHTLRGSATAATEA